MRILIVDDDPQFRLLVRRALEKLSCIVDAAGNREAALALINNVHYDVIILDLVFPAANGSEILERIRELDPCQPVMILSGYVTAEIGRDLNEDNYTLIFEKPVMTTALEELLLNNIVKFKKPQP